MQKLLAFVLLFVISQAAMAQWQISHKIGFGAGHEWNVFLNPRTAVNDGETLTNEELWDNGTFQSVFFNNSFRYDTGRHRLKFKVNTSAGLYQTEESANRYAYDLGFSYRVKYAKRKYFEFAPELNRRRRQGINEADAVLRTPFSYTILTIPVHFDFYLSNKTWLKTQAGYLSKNYDRENGEELLYRAPFLTVMISKKWQTKLLTKKLSFSHGTQFRNYFELERSTPFDPEEEEEDFEEIELEEKTRQWNYFRSHIEYQLTGAKKDFDIVFGLYHIARLDVDETNSYSEIAPGIQFKYGFDRIKFTSSTKYAIRNYQNLSPGAGNDLLLRY
ncbi:MAG: hypothetical protein AAFX87_30130, partial [Bacteroidota bacterium]